MTAWDFLKIISQKCSGFFSSEHPGQKVTTSELKRWLINKSVQINGQKPNWDDTVAFPVKDMVLFPKSKNRITTLASEGHPFVLVQRGA